jgi:hypothetical protein
VRLSVPTIIHPLGVYMLHIHAHAHVHVHVHVMCMYVPLPPACVWGEVSGV